MKTFLLVCESVILSMVEMTPFTDKIKKYMYANCKCQVVTEDFTSYSANILPQFPGVPWLYPIYIVSMFAETILEVVEVVVGSR